ncbi:energy transducer TonB family protein [Flavobacterium sp.]|uniref:energy transducer TonB family protein n=1 Tax=Flavobacterium sp. TaxID=239 RepID=UPI003B991FD6
MTTNEYNHNKESFIATTVLFALLLLGLYFFKFSNTTNLLEFEGGGGGGDVAVNFGDSEFGRGDNYDAVDLSAAAPQPKATEVQEEEIIATEDDAADVPAVTTTAKPKEKEKEKPKEKVVEPVKPKPNQAANDAMASLLGGKGKSGDGNDKQGGNKGKQNGDPNASGYYGGGGSGTGSGGGNGSGQGVGSGSGYGSGSGNGRGSGVGNYTLAGRKALSIPNPKYTCNEEGTVVCEITVDNSGKVIGVVAGIRGSTNVAKCLLDQAKAAAQNARFDAKDDAPGKQVGKIVYNFKLN